MDRAARLVQQFETATGVWGNGDDVAMTKKTAVLGRIVILWAAFACGLVMLAQTAQAQAKRQSLHYSLYISGFRVGAVKLNGVMTDKAYNVRGSMGGAGIGKAFVPSTYSGSVSGFVRRSGLLPHEFSARFDRGRKYFTVDISYNKGRPRVVDIFPVPAKRDYDLNIKKLRDVLDPLSATFKLLRPVPKEEVCNYKQNIYEGRRLSLIQLGKPVEDDDKQTISCGGSYTRIDGYPPDLMKKQTKFNFTVTYDQVEGGLYQIENFVSQTTFGRAKGVRK